jgi:pSer/pThr/pTyr-binding forkhead associated (FHA) protein
MSPSSHYVLTCGKAPLIQFLVTGKTAVVGRSTTCDFVIADASVSRRHAELRPRAGWIEVADLESRNGTFVSDRKIQVERVGPGAVVRFGHVAFTVTLVGATSEVITDYPGRLPEDGKGPVRVTPDDLSSAQRRVFELLVEGHAEKTIAKELCLSRHTVHNHTRAIFRVFGVHSRPHLLVAVANRGGPNKGPR